MNIKIAGQSSKGNYHNTGSCGGAVTYNEHELEDRPKLYEELGVTQEDLTWFDMEGNVISGAEVMDKIGRLRAHLGKNDAKFYCTMINPSDEEALAMGATIQEQILNGRAFVFDVMDAYAANFHRDGITDRHDLVAFAIPHIYKSGGKQQIHWHVIQARKDASNKYKLSPLTNHRNTTKGVVKGGFDLVKFDTECERLFDERFKYQRRVEQSFDYLRAEKKGTAEEKAVQEAKLALQNLPDLEESIKTAITRRVERLAREATERATRESQAAEEKARIEAEEIEKANKNKFWNAYNSHYKPLIDGVQKNISASFRMHDTLKEEIRSYGREITERYDRLRQVNDQINLAKQDVDRASSSKGLWAALSGLVAIVNPVAGLVMGLVTHLVAEANRSAAVDTRNTLYAEAKAIRDDINKLKEEQSLLREKDAEVMKVAIEDKAQRQELFDEINALKAELTTPKRSLADFAKRYEEYKAGKTVDEQEAPRSQGLSSAAYAYARKDEILSIFRSSSTPEELRRELASHGMTIREVTTDIGLDIIITAGGDKSFAINASKFGADYTRQLLDAYKKVTKKPGEASEIRKAKVASASVDNRAEQNSENEADTPRKHYGYKR